MSEPGKGIDDKVKLFIPTTENKPTCNLVMFEEPFISTCLAFKVSLPERVILTVSLLTKLCHCVS